MKTKLGDIFRHPPQGGTGAGVPVANTMARVPSPVDSPLAPQSMYGGGISVGERDQQRTIRAMKPEDAYNAVMLGKPPFSPPGTLRAAFEAGELAARRNLVQAGDVGQNDMRNFSRGGQVDALRAGEDDVSAYDVELAQTGSSGYWRDGTPGGGGDSQPRPRPTGNNPLSRNDNVSPISVQDDPDPFA